MKPTATTKKYHKVSSFDSTQCGITIYDGHHGPHG
jgi:hypothetical protein